MLWLGGGGGGWLFQSPFWRFELSGMGPQGMGRQVHKFETVYELEFTVCGRYEHLQKCRGVEQNSQTFPWF